VDIRQGPIASCDNGEMGRTYEVIDHGLAEWLEAQPVFFVSTAPLSANGLVNCSPKGNRDEFVVVDERTVAYLDQTGSGIETIAHLRENGRIVVMFCAFVGAPRIVRLHGRGRAVLTDDPSFPDLAGRFPGRTGVGVRSIVVVEVSRIADSCGYGVPFMSIEGHRPTMDQWSNRKGPEGIRKYRAEKNAKSIDQLDGITSD
jgi:Pyridoxamine 5'-phosphate oxidase